MEVKILYGGVALFGGWLWFYMLLRQFLFNIMTAYPVIKRMKKIDKELIAIGATRYTTISLIVTGLVAAVIAFLIFHFGKSHIYINFVVGGVIGLLMYIRKLDYKNRAMFEAFCNSYYRFVPDDELRTAIYNKKYGQVKSRLKAMGFDETFVPEFREKKVG